MWGPRVKRAPVWLMVGLCCVAWPSLAEKTATDRAVEVHGHRGARARVTENTLEAFRLALKAGVDVLELDLVATADGELLVNHDLHFAPGVCLAPGGRRPRGSVAIHSLTLKQARKWRCRVPKDRERFPKQRELERRPLPTFAEVLELVKSSQAPAAKTVRLNVETKTVPGKALSPPPAEFAKLVVDELKAAGLLDRAILQSFDHDVLVAADALAPGLKLAALVAETHPDLVAVARAAKADILSPHHEWITKADVDKLHKAGVEVVPWTVNRPADWERMVAIGVDGIITDDPGALIAWLKERQKKER